MNVASDAVDAAPGDGVCAVSGGVGSCTLRAAIQEANALPGRDTIMLPPQTITLTIAGPSEDLAAKGDLDILDDLDIKGQGASSIVDGAALDRVFDCAPGGGAAPIHVRLAGLTVRNGLEAIGGAIRFTGDLLLAGVVFKNNTADLVGGAISADSLLGAAAPTLTVVRSSFDGNAAYGDGGAIDAGDAASLLVRQSSFTNNSTTVGWGGAIALPSAGATVLDSFFEENSAFVGGALSSLGSAGDDIRRATFHLNAAYQGGAAHLDVASVANVTFWDNTAASVGGGLSQVGASGPLSINNVTFKGNWANGTAFTGGSALRADAAILSNTVFDGNQSFNNVKSCQIASLTDLGFNVADDNTCALNDPHDLPVTTRPLVEDLGAMNGGIMLTNAPVAGGPLIEGGNPATPGSVAGACELDDERQVTRPALGDPNAGPTPVCDIGAVEICRAPANAPDFDNDGIPDVCDDDDDNDGCLDGNDRHPHQAGARGGPVLEACGPNHTWSYFEGADTDGDGLLNCEDDDDDDDGVPDDLDDCPASAGAASCARLGNNPCAPDWFTCRGGGCNEQFLKFLYLPDPERSIVFDHYEVVNDRFYAGAPAGSTAAATIATLSGRAVTGRAAVAEPLASSASVLAETPIARAGLAATISLPPAVTRVPPSWRVEVWARAAKRGQPARLLGVVREQLRAADLVVEAVDTGNIISMSLPFQDGSVRLGTAWAVGTTGVRLPDADGDTVPDAFDDCVYTPNRSQADGNRNGVGDVCEVTASRDERLKLLARVSTDPVVAERARAAIRARR